MRIWPYARWAMREVRRATTDILHGWRPVLQDDQYFRGTIEPTVDTFYQTFPIMGVRRDSALIHLLRFFEDLSRLGTAPALQRGNLQFHGYLRRAHEGIPWAVRWIWDNCPNDGDPSLELAWDKYEQAAKLFNHAYDYFHLYRCFVLFSRGHFRCRLSRNCARIKFSWSSKPEKVRDAGRQMRENYYDSAFAPSPTILQFMAENIPLVRTLLPACLERIGDNDIRYRIPPRLSDLFRRWADLQANEMRFELPGSWEFEGYSLEQFRNFWRSLLTVAMIHVYAHYFAESVGVRGCAAGSIVIQIHATELERIGGVFGADVRTCRAIIHDLTYSPRGSYWDPFWQPLFRLRNDTFLISPSLLMGSSAERNLVALLNRIPAKRHLYQRLSNEKEATQLDELGRLFSDARFFLQRRIPVTRADGTPLSDVDLLVFDRADESVLIIQAKWLIRPDYWSEVLSRDEELTEALGVLRATKARIVELGAPWLSGVLGTETTEPLRILAMVVNRDFLPSGWVYDPDFPIVDMAFLREFAASGALNSVGSLHVAATNLDKTLKKRFPVLHSSDDIQVGAYVFEVPSFLIR